MLHPNGHEWSHGLWVWGLGGHSSPTLWRLSLKWQNSLSWQIPQRGLSVWLGGKGWVGCARRIGSWRKLDDSNHAHAHAHAHVHVRMFSCALGKLYIMTASGGRGAADWARTHSLVYAPRWPNKLSCFRSSLSVALQGWDEETLTPPSAHGTQRKRAEARKSSLGRACARGAGHSARHTCRAEKRRGGEMRKGGCTAQGAVSLERAELVTSLGRPTLPGPENWRNVANTRLYACRSNPLPTAVCRACRHAKAPEQVCSDDGNKP